MTKSHLLLSIAEVCYSLNRKSFSSQKYDFWKKSFSEHDQEDINWFKAEAEVALQEFLTTSSGEEARYPAWLKLVQQNLKQTLSVSELGKYYGLQEG